MSVINQMLRDLDRRTMAADRAIYASHVAREASRRFAWRHWVVAGVVIAGGTALSMTIANWQDSSNPATRATTPPVVEKVVAPRSQESLSEAVVDAPATAIAAAPLESRIPTNAAPKSIDPVPNKTNVAERTATPPQPAMTSAPTSAALAARPPRNRIPFEPVPAPEEGLSPAITSSPPPPQSEKRIVREETARTAESEYRHAAVLIDQGRLREAQDRLRNSLDMNARHEAARQTLAALLLEERSYDAAAAVLAVGLQHNPAQTNFALTLARLHLERNDMPAALGVLREHARYATDHAEYRAFAGALYAKSGAHAEAIKEYEAALGLAPQMGSWWIGLGLACEAADRIEAATDAFRKARATGNLSAGLSQFLERKLQRK